MDYRSMRTLVLLLPMAALAQPPSKVLVVTGKEVLTDIVSLGNLACVGGAPSNNPQGPPCTPGTTRILFSYRNTLARYDEVTGSAAAMAQGQNNIVTHCNLDQNYYGHCWGHFVWTIPGSGGQWEGTWNGKMDMATNTVSYSATGYGYGGTLEGLQMKYEAAYTGPGPGLFIAKVSPK